MSKHLHLYTPKRMYVQAIRWWGTNIEEINRYLPNADITLTSLNNLEIKVPGNETTYIVFTDEYIILDFYPRSIVTMKDFLFDHLFV